ncbi:MAG TPA: SdpI family protein [Thermobifida alba]|nr:SdpI family protein [Thermobifida alba]
MAEELPIPAVLSSASIPEEPLTGAPLLLISVLLLLCGVLLVVTGVLGARGRLRPNPLVGIRTHATLSDERLWYAVHRRVAPWVVGAGAVFSAGGTVLLLLGDSVAQVVTILGTAPAALVLVGAGSVLAHRAAHRVGEAEGR